MTISVSCRGCGKQYQVAAKFAGRKVKCRECGAGIGIPAATPDDPRESVPAPERESRPTIRGPRSRPPRTTSRIRSSPSQLPQKSSTLPIIGGVAGLLALVGIAFAAYSALRPADAPEIAATPAASPAHALAASPDIPEVVPESAATIGGIFAEVPVPTFGDLGDPIETFASGVKLYFVDLGTIAANGRGPGMQMAMRVYVPGGEHARHSLPCVLVAPAGTNLLTGCAMDADDYHAETLPYAEAGMVYLFYGLDGHSDLETASNADLKRAYLAFQAAQGGMINGRNAMEFALEKLPQVNPDQVVVAGHSSAATLSLLMGSHDPRITACIAYCPSTDLELRMGDVIRDPGVQRLLPGVNDFIRKTSPATHVAGFSCPVFLFGVHDDTNTPLADTQAFAARLRDHGTDVTLETSPHGGHYQPMIDAGIPGAIRWLQGHVLAAATK